MRLSRKRATLTPLIGVLVGIGSFVVLMLCFWSLLYLVTHPPENFPRP